MLPAELELRVGLKVRSEGLDINGLVRAVVEKGNEWSSHVVSEVLWRMQEEWLEGVLAGEHEIACSGCGVVATGPGTLLRRGSRPRKVRTSAGVIGFRLRQVTCPECRKTWSPFPELLGLAPRQRVLDELLHRLVDWVTELSYRKTTRIAGEWLGSTVSPRTLHAEVQRRGAEIVFTEEEPLGTVLADGTKVPAGEQTRGEDISVAFQLQGRRTKHGRPAVEKRVVGFSIGWGHWHETLATDHEPELLVTDGETGVGELAEWYFPEARHQRCEWHIPYSLGRNLGEDGMDVESRREKAKELGAILARGAQDSEKAEKGKKAYRTFKDELSDYPTAWTLLDNAEPYVLYAPPSAERTTSVMEREMRELNRRTDVGARWSVGGIANLLRLRLAKRHNPDDYARLWSPLRAPALTLVSHA